MKPSEAMLQVGQRAKTFDAAYTLSERIHERPSTTADWFFFRSRFRTRLTKINSADGVSDGVSRAKEHETIAA